MKKLHGLLLVLVLSNNATAMDEKSNSQVFDFFFITANLTSKKTATFKEYCLMAPLTHLKK